MPLTTLQKLEIGVNVGICAATTGIIGRGLFNNNKYDESNMFITYDFSHFVVCL